MKYIFVSGAPGSKWSSVVKNIYYSADVDSTDYSEARTYRHDASGTMELLHMGVYWGPAMEFGNHFEHLDQHTREQNEAEFDAPFSGTGVRIIKSHVFGYHIVYCFGFLHLHQNQVLDVVVGLVVNYSIE